jgi:hypothetical protein
MNDLPYAMCAFYAERCVLSSCSGMFYDGVFGSEGCVLVGVGGVKLMIWNSGVFFLLRM